MLELGKFIFPFYIMFFVKTNFFYNVVPKSDRIAEGIERIVVEFLKFLNVFADNITESIHELIGFRGRELDG